MKSKSRNIIMLAAALIFTVAVSSCGNNYEINKTQYAKIYMPQARQYPHKAGILLKDSTQDFVYGGAYAGPTQSLQDINVEFVVEQAKVDSFNNQNLTSYPILPKETYTLSKTEAVIPAGQNSTPPLKLKINPSGYITKRSQMFLLPITMKEVNSDVKMNKELQTTYFLIQGTFPNYPLYDKTSWNVIDFSSQFECCGDTYLAFHVIDGNTYSDGPGAFWLDVDPLPQYVTIDMQSAHAIHGVKIVGNAAGGGANYINRNPRKVTIKFSSDGVTWKHSVDITLPFSQSVVMYKFYLASKGIQSFDARYIKFIVNSTVGGGDILNLNEISPF